MGHFWTAILVRTDLILKPPEVSPWEGGWHNNRQQKTTDSRQTSRLIDLIGLGANAVGGYPKSDFGQILHDKRGEDGFSKK